MLAVAELAVVVVGLVVVRWAVLFHLPPAGDDAAFLHLTIMFGNSLAAALLELVVDTVTAAFCGLSRVDHLHSQRTQIWLVCELCVW